MLRELVRGTDGSVRGTEPSVAGTEGKTHTWWTFRVFFIFSGGGVEGGVRGARKGGCVFGFLLKIPKEGGGILRDTARITYMHHIAKIVFEWFWYLFRYE